MMTPRSQFLIQVLEKLASPMVAAISEVSVRTNMIPDASQKGALKPEAEQVAQLLTKSTQLSIGLSELMDLKVDEKEADSIRLALTSLASPLVANVYRIAGRVPTDIEMEKVVGALNAVMPFSDQFVTASDVNARMAHLDTDFFPVDPHQITLQYLNLLLPAVNSIMAYSFGQNEKKLIQEVSAKLIEDSKAFRVRIFPDLSESEAARSELAVLRMASMIYSQCHFGEMAKLMATEEQARQGLAPTMDSLWQAFGLRMQMLEILADTLIPGGKKRKTSSSSSSKTPQRRSDDKVPDSSNSGLNENAMAESRPIKPPETVKNSQKSSKSEEKTQEKTGDSSDPMSFFVKKNSA
jgi:hypothetical protein